MNNNTPTAEPVKKINANNTISIKGCSVKLNFLTDCNGKSIDIAKKMLIASLHQDTVEMEDKIC